MYLVFDIGGTSMRFAYSLDGENILDPVVYPTPQSFRGGLEIFTEVYNKIKEKTPIERIAGGVAGAFSKGRTELLQSPHLPDWIGNPIRDRFMEITGKEVYLENDTAMVGLGEAFTGAGRGYDIVAYITISTGVGGTRIVKNNLDLSTFNFEPGHQIIDADGSMCPDCKAYEDGFSLGHWESMISGTSMKKRYGKDPSNIDDSKIWEETARLVACGLNNTIVHWTPEVVVLGGGMMKSPGLTCEMIETHLREILKIYPVHPVLRKAELGDFGGLHGSLRYLRQREKTL